MSPFLTFPIIEIIEYVLGKMPEHKNQKATLPYPRIRSSTCLLSYVDSFQNPLYNFSLSLHASPSINWVPDLSRRIGKCDDLQSGIVIDLVVTSNVSILFTFSIPNVSTSIS